MVQDLRKRKNERKQALGEDRYFCRKQDNEEPLCKSSSRKESQSSVAAVSLQRPKAESLLVVYFSALAKRFRSVGVAPETNTRWLLVVVVVVERSLFTLQVWHRLRCLEQDEADTIRATD